MRHRLFATKTRLFATLLFVSLSCSVFGQEAISAKAGMVNYFEGSVNLNGEALAYKASTFHQVGKGGKLETTATGRAEVLLSPGVFLWVGESSTIELVSDSLADARVRLLAGNVVVSSTEFPKDILVSIAVNDEEIRIAEAGIYNIGMNPALLAVNEGRADVVRADGVETRVKKGRSLELGSPNATIAKIDKNAPKDSLSLWANSRDNYIQVANLSAARQIQTTGGFRNVGMISSLGMYGNFGTWFYNPYFGMYTYVPFRQGMLSPYGTYYWSPNSVNSVYRPGWGGQISASRASVARSGFTRSADVNPMYGRGLSSFGVDGMSQRGPILSGRSATGISRGSMGGGSSSGGISAGAPSGGGAVSSGGASMGRGGGGGASRGSGGGGRQ